MLWLIQYNSAGIVHSRGDLEWTQLYVSLSSSVITHITTGESRSMTLWSNHDGYVSYFRPGTGIQQTTVIHASSPVEELR